MNQPTLFPTPTVVPKPIVDMIEGMAAQWAYGDHRTAAQNRTARIAAEECGEIIARLRPVRDPV